MADHHYYSSCLLGVMDRLWFHQVILFSEPSSSSSSAILLPKILRHQTSSLITSSLINFPSTTSLSLSSSTSNSTYEEIPSPLLEDEFSSSSSSDSSPFTSEVNKGHLNNDEKEEYKVVNKKERPTRLNNIGTNRARSHSSSPSTAKRSKKSIGLRKILQKSMSCKTLGELELEEVKGFMDLGFVFNKEQINPRIISVVPGLLRLGLYKQKQNSSTKLLSDSSEAVVVTEDEAEEEEEEEEDNSDINGDKYDDDEDDEMVRDEEEGISRPYLSEAWLIKRPDSPLLNLRLPKVSAAADMKKHLKCWARTVASEIHQES